MVSGETSRHTGDSSVDGSKGVPADSRCDIMALELRPATEERMPSKMADPTAVASVRRSSVHSTAANSAVRRSAVPTPSNTKQHQATQSQHAWHAKGNGHSKQRRTIRDATLCGGITTALLEQR